MFLQVPKFVPVHDAEGFPIKEDGLPLIRGAKPLRYLCTDGSVIEVPSTFHGNGGSVPSPVRWFVHPHDEAALPCFHLHDFNYAKAERTRRVSDRILFYGLRCRGVSFFRSLMIWLAVRAFGWQHWRPTHEK